MNYKIKGMMVLLLAILVLGCTDSTEIENVQPVIYVPTPTSTPIATPEPVSEGSYYNPATTDLTVVLTTFEGTFEITIWDVIRGTEADEKLWFYNEFWYEEAAAGYEYCLIDVEVKYVDGTESCLISYFDFTAWAEDIELESNSFSLMDLPSGCPEFTQGKLMPGGTKSGWMLFTVPQDTEVIIAYVPNMFFDSGAYFTIGQ